MITSWEIVAIFRFVNIDQASEMNRKQETDCMASTTSIWRDRTRQTRNGRRADRAENPMNNQEQNGDRRRRDLLFGAFLSSIPRKLLSFVIDHRRSSDELWQRFHEYGTLIHGTRRDLNLTDSWWSQWRYVDKWWCTIPSLLYRQLIVHRVRGCRMCGAFVARRLRSRQSSLQDLFREMTTFLSSHNGRIRLEKSQYLSVKNSRCRRNAEHVTPGKQPCDKIMWKCGVIHEIRSNNRQFALSLLRTRSDAGRHLYRANRFDALTKRFSA